jgi:predicted Rossmann-fold nucleotide-binding protein
MLKKVISGGQTGADQNGVETAFRFGLKTGGVMPKGFITQAGPRQAWAKKYGLTEHTSTSYVPRTIINVQTSDGTIRLAGDFGSAGEVLTLKAIKQYNKQWIDVDLLKPRPVQEVVDWINTNNIQVLNVAGNSEKTFMGTGQETMEYLTKVFLALGFTDKSQA